MEDYYKQNGSGMIKLIPKVSAIFSIAVGTLVLIG
jgi:preprotein translocase subunit Sec61beta